ncbi:MAG TPA: FAD-dependent oxidoreductase [Pirellulales bacterium]|nr:FAD-dependent oxidoreductase [Pirellulales bacterium]
MIRERRESLVVIGNGMAGARVVEEILHRSPDRFTITMFGDEPHGNYNRIQLSTVLGGFTDPEKITLNSLDWYQQNRIRLHAPVRAERIDRRDRVVFGRAKSGQNGSSRQIELAEPYHKLIIATGSRPFVPPLEGRDKPGVFVFRTLDDCWKIADAARQSKRAVVVGGGLLGLEAARGLLNYGVEVTVVEVAPHLMVQQLDPAAGAILKQKMESLGVHVVTGQQVTQILGDDGVTGISFKDGTSIDTDMVIVSCGIRPNSEIAKDSGLAVERAIVVDDQMRCSDEDIFGVGECVQHRGRVYGLVEPLYEQAKVLADLICETNPAARYEGSRLATSLKVMGVELTSIGDGNSPVAELQNAQVLVHSDPERGQYRKMVIRDGRLTGAIVLGGSESVGLLMRLFKRNDPVPDEPLELLVGRSIGFGDDANAGLGVAAIADDVDICNCHKITKGHIVDSIRAGATSVDALGSACKAGTGCGSCQTLLGQLITAYSGAEQADAPEKLNKIEVLKREREPLDILPDIHQHAASGDWKKITEEETHLMKWRGLFFRKQTPGNFMMRIRSTAGHMNSRQWRMIAQLSDQYGHGFCDLTTRQQVQMRWFTIGDVPDIWEQLEAVGLTTLQTGMDNVRGVCGCPAGGITPNELFDATPIAEEFTQMLVGNTEFTNLPRKFNVTITGCLENCCHPETQDIGLVPAIKEIDGKKVAGFNVLAGGKQGSGGYLPAAGLDVFVAPEQAADICRQITFIFRDHGSRQTRTRARLAFLIEDRGVAWFRRELERRVGRRLPAAGTDQRKKKHTDHIGVFRQKQAGLNFIGLCVPVGRITTKQMRGIADLADRYGDGEIRLTVTQNLILPGIPDAKLGDLTEEPLLKELSYNPSPVMRGLVSCTGIDYCHMALIETKGWAIEVAKQLEKKLGDDLEKVAPLSIHWSGCPASCGMHQVSTIGMQGCRSRLANGEIVDAAHVFVGGSTGPKAKVAAELLHDVPCDQLADALKSLVQHAPR